MMLRYQNGYRLEQAEEPFEELELDNPADVASSALERGYMKRDLVMEQIWRDRA